MDLGLELLMNPKKKVQSDNGSVINGDTGSVRSVKVKVNTKSDEVSQITDDDESFEGSVKVNEMDRDDRSSYSGGSEISDSFESHGLDGVDGSRGPPPRGLDGSRGPPPRGLDGSRGPPRGLDGSRGPPPRGLDGSRGPPPRGLDGTPSEVSYRSRSSRRSADAKYSGKSASNYSSSIGNSDGKSDIESLGSMLVKGEKQHSSTTQYKNRMSEEDILSAKRELLYQFDRLEKKGLKLPKKFTLASNFEDMKTEYERLKRDRELDNSIKFQRRGLTMFTSGVEFLNQKFDPCGARLDGWSQSVHETIEDYDDIFEELHEKWGGKARISPEVKLLWTLGGSAFMFHMTQSMFKNMPGAEQVLKQNPELKRQFAAAAANTMHQQQPQGSLFSGLSGMFSNMFGGGNPADKDSNMQMPQQHAPMPSSQTFNMRGPSNVNVEDIMKELDMNDNDRIEALSTVTSSEFTEIQDDVSINNLIYATNKGGKKKQTKGRSVTINL